MIDIELIASEKTFSNMYGNLMENSPNNHCGQWKNFIT